MGTGNIARQFTDGVIRSGRRSEVIAVGSRSVESANAFAGERKIPNVHGSYDALLADPTVDAIYNSLPNSLHHEWTIKSLRAGKRICVRPNPLGELAYYCVLPGCVGLTGRRDLTTLPPPMRKA
jgi:predicted dehydrogenase